MSQYGLTNPKTDCLHFLIRALLLKTAWELKSDEMVTIFIFYPLWKLKCSFLLQQLLKKCLPFTNSFKVKLATMSKGS